MYTEVTQKLTKYIIKHGLYKLNPLSYFISSAGKHIRSIRLEKGY